MRMRGLYGVSVAALSLAISFGYADSADANGVTVQSDYKAAETNRCNTGGLSPVAGSNTCLKISGFAKYIAGVSSSSMRDIGNIASVPPVVGADMIIKDPADSAKHVGIWQKAIARLKFDAKSDSDYGTVRGFVEVQADNNDPALKLRHAYVQLDRLLLGKTTSSWVHTDSSVGNIAPSMHLIADPLPRVMQVRYTHPLAAGMSVSVALEDRSEHEVVYSGYSETDVPTGQERSVPQNPNGVPAVVVALKSAGSWGSAQLSAVGVSQNGYEDAWNARRWGVLAGAKVNMFEGGDVLGAHAIYTSGLNPKIYGGMAQEAYWKLRTWSDHGNKASNLGAMSALVWYKRAWADQYNTVAGLGYTSLVRLDKAQKAVLTNKDTHNAMVLFVNNNYNITKDLKASVDVIYAKREWCAGDAESESRNGWGASVQLTRLF